MAFDLYDPNVKTYGAPHPTGRVGVNLGPQQPNSIFATAGVFPIQEINFSSHDKWLFGDQIGADWLVVDHSRLVVRSLLLPLRKSRRARNAFESLQYNYTAPQFIQKGNSLVAINDADQPDCNTGTLGAQNVCLVGLASGLPTTPL